MEDLKHKIQGEIKNISLCKLKDIHDMKNWSPDISRDGYLCVFEYTVPLGSLTKNQVTVGIELPMNDYPRLPPHFIHLKLEEFSQEIIHKMGKIHQQYEQEGKWMILSRPPQDIWDDLSDSRKNLYTFFNSHLRRFWESL